MLSRLRTWWHDRPARIAARESRLLSWNAKVMGSALAARLYAEGFATPTPDRPSRTNFGGRLCRQDDIEADWLRFWCAELNFAPVYHRKLWEDCYAVQMLYERGMLTPGKRALGFAVGSEWLPSLFASAGVDVVATDLPAQDRRARPWLNAAQHGGNADALFKPEVVSEELFRRHVTLRPVDMNHIPGSLEGFDFLWSVCSLEHCGTLQKGMDFVVNAMRCLRPGGVAVHTTEFNLDPDGPTLERGRTVLYQRRHIEALAARLEAAGHRMLPVDFDLGDGVLDRYVDLPPFDAQPWFLPRAPVPHLRLAYRGFAVTSLGFVVVAGR
ncbi:SAM-dependent methyltransferase [Roseomonas sp. CCTCC AB2023176]|uniref:SAM-dependent methyltransferase n=1 Tax=Roseomonas sp. CCTCC AB2023176 TaxID=3342640 RepID=UPI0035DA99FE